MPLLDPVSSWLLRRAARRRDKGYDDLIEKLDGIPDDGCTMPNWTSDIQYLSDDLHAIDLRPSGIDDRADVVVLVQFTRPGVQISISEILIKRPPEALRIRLRNDFDRGCLTANMLIDGNFPPIPVCAMHDKRDLISHTLDSKWSRNEHMTKWADLRIELETLRP